MKPTRFTQLAAHTRSYCKGSVNNVMSPLTWMTVLVEGILGALTTTNAFLGIHFWIQVVLVILMTAVLIFYGVVYTYYMLTNPLLLQTEDYNLELQALNYLYGKDELDVNTDLKILPMNHPTIQGPKE